MFLFLSAFTTKMTNRSKKMDSEDIEREAEQAFKSVTTGTTDDFDSEFDSAFPGAFHDQAGNHSNFNSNHLQDHQQGSFALSNTTSKLSKRQESVPEPVKTHGVPTSLTSCSGQVSSSHGLKRQLNTNSSSPETCVSPIEQPHSKPYLDREPQKARGRPSRKSSVPPGIRKLPSPPTTLEQAQMEWDLVETVQPGSGPSGTHSPTVSFNEAVRHFQTASYLEQHMSHIKPTVRRRGFSAITHALFGPSNMDSGLHTERNLIFTLALCMFRNEEDLHATILQTIYKKLTGTKLDCPRYGNHWELIGFQGLDPATDLRGCGLLGLINVLYLVTNERTHGLALEIYRLSQHETQNFPFCVMSINITRISLQALREGKLNKECNNRQQVMATFSEFYVAIFFHVYQIWKHQHKTISDSGFVLKETEKYAMHKPKDALRQLERTLSERKNLIIPEEENMSPKNRQATVIDRFAGICDLPAHEEEEVHLV